MLYWIHLQLLFRHYGNDHLSMSATFELLWGCGCGRCAATSRPVFTRLQPAFPVLQSRNAVQTPVMGHNYLHRKAPRYLTDYCIPVSDVASRRHLCFVRRHYLVPWHSLSSYGRRAFAVASPTAWNSLSDDLRDPTLSTDSFRHLLKTRCFQSTSTYSALEEVSHFMLHINSWLTCLPTYLLGLQAAGMAG